LTISVFDYFDVGPSSVVYIFHKGIFYYYVAMKYRWICNILILSIIPYLKFEMDKAKRRCLVVLKHPELHIN